MPRDIRYIPPDSLVEVTNRTVEGRFFMRPSREVNEIIRGVLAKAVHVYRMRTVAYIFLSSHYHLLLHPRNVSQLSTLMNVVDGQIAKELNRLHGRSGPFWHRRYRPILVSDEEEAQVPRLRYILENSVKEALVASPRDWPGVHSTQALLHGGEIEGVWFDRTAESRAHQRGEKPGRYDHTTRYAFRLSPLVSWDVLAPTDHQARVAAMCKAIEYHHRERRRAEDRTVLGARRIRRQSPWKRAKPLKRSPAPRFHAATPEIRVMLEREYRKFADAYRDAAENLRAGRPYRFPGGCFPPALPYQPTRPPPFAAPA